MFSAVFPSKSTPETYAPQADRQVSDTGLAHLAQLPASLQHLTLHLAYTKVPDALAFFCP